MTSKQPIDVKQLTKARKAWNKMLDTSWTVKKLYYNEEQHCYQVLLSSGETLTVDEADIRIMMKD